MRLAQPMIVIDEEDKSIDSITINSIISSFNHYSWGIYPPRERTSSDLSEILSQMKNIFHSRGESAFSKIMSNFSELYKTIHNMGLIYLLKQIIVTSEIYRPVFTLHKNM